MVLIGMPGIEKRVARFPQFYSRIGFVHEFRPLDEAQMARPLNERWLPAGVRLPDALLAPEVIATLIRMSGGGNFRLLTQVERFLKVNQSPKRLSLPQETVWSSDRAELECTNAYAK